MPSLLDNIDRFTHTIEAIKQSASHTPSTPYGPFTKAVLKTHLGDLARDVDPSELGLFTVVSTSSIHTHALEKDATNAARNELARVEFPGATPLRRPVSDKTNDGTRESRDKDPEVYVEAALKYLDRYDSVRSMPRARQEITSIMERLGTVRDQIQILTEDLMQSSQADSLSQTSVPDEEKKIHELQSRIKQLKSRQEILLRKGTAKLSRVSKKSDSKPPSAVFASKTSPIDKQEESFWNPRSIPNSPALPSSMGESLLLESEVDMANMSMVSSFDIPTPVRPTRTATERIKFAPSVIVDVTEEAGSSRDMSSEPTSTAPPIASWQQAITQQSAEDEADVSVDQDETVEEADRTVVLPKLAPPTEAPVLSRTMTQETALPSVDESAHESVQITNSNPSKTVDMAVATPGASKRGKIKVTRDTEVIVAKVWSTVGDIIMPGHPFNTASAATVNRPPRAKETITLLQSLAAQSPSLSSPSTHSTLSQAINPSSSGAPTPHQILTSHMLITLLSSPNYSMPLKDLKEALTARGLGTPQTGVAGLVGLGLGGQGTETRVLYGCVAKRLVKIDRGASVQTVRFDV